VEASQNYSDYSDMALWQNYKALVFHFEEAKNDKNRDKKERCTYEGLITKITSVGFILDLGLMCDGLQELSELSFDLQERNLDLNKAHNKIVCLVNVF
jgi:ribosomal protein S1